MTNNDYNTAAAAAVNFAAEEVALARFNEALKAAEAAAEGFNVAAEDVAPLKRFMDKLAREVAEMMPLAMIGAATVAQMEEDAARAERADDPRSYGGYL